jgi:hypothetical protein
LGIISYKGSRFAFSPIQKGIYIAFNGKNNVSTVLNIGIDYAMPLSFNPIYYGTQRQTHGQYHRNRATQSG